MRLLVTGSRTWDDIVYIRNVLDDLLAASQGIMLYHGACPIGADFHADTWATDRLAHGSNILITRFPAKWRNRDGVFDRTAGLHRNAEMIRAVGSGGVVACHAFIRDHSRGTSHCAKLARRAGIPVTTHKWEDR